MAADLEVLVRKVYRDLEAIQEAGLPLYSDKVDRNSYRKLMDGFKAGVALPSTTTERSDSAIVARNQDNDAAASARPKAATPLRSPDESQCL